MIIPKYTTGGNIFTKIFDMINKIFGIIRKDKPKAKDHPKKYTDQQYDNVPQYGVGTRLGTYKGYKLHLVASADDIYISLLHLW